MQAKNRQKGEEDLIEKFTVAILLFFGVLPSLWARVDCTDQVSFELATCLHGMKRFGEAFPVMKAAAEQNNRGAQLVLADMYFSGEGTHRSFVKAIYWGERAFRSGARGAEKRLAGFYHEKKGSEEHYIGWLSAAAQHGDPGPMVWLGDLYAQEPSKFTNMCLSDFWYSRALNATQSPRAVEKLNAQTIIAVTAKLELVREKCVSAQATQLSTA